MLFYAADDDAAGDLVAGLIRTGGYEPVRAGGLDQSIRIEMFGDLHEYGSLGRVVTKSEALKGDLTFSASTPPPGGGVLAPYRQFGAFGS